MKRAIFCTCVLIAPMLTLWIGVISPFKAPTLGSGGCDVRVVKREKGREGGETADGELHLKVSRYRQPVICICNSSW